MGSAKEVAKLRIIKHLLRLGAYLQREAGRLLADFGLTQQQFVVLMEIQEKGPVSQREICSELLFEKSNVSKIVKKLTTDKLVKMTYSSEDSRISLLTIAQKGSIVIERCMQRLNEWNRIWLKSLTGAEVSQSTEVLDRLSALTGD